MNADEFANRLATIAPPTSSLLAFGMNAQEAEQFRAAYLCRRITRSNESDPLLDLCSSFDISTVEISVVTLCRPHDFDQQTWAVGLFEADTIVYPKNKGMVSIRDHENLNREVCKCGSTSGGFLSALIVAAEFGANGILQPNQTQDATAGRQALDRCLAFAGKECEPFYRVLLGLH